MKGFFVNDGEGNGAKQYINLSEDAWFVIDEDRRYFGNFGEDISESGFLNRIFENYYQKAEASISLRVYEKKEELINLYSTKEFSSFDKDLINSIIKENLKVYEKSLIDKYAPEKGSETKKSSDKTKIAIRFRINKKNVEILKNSPEGEFYERLARRYLNGIFEEYASKPLYDREQIFFADVVEEINKAIYLKKKLKVSTVKLDKENKKKKETFMVSCYKLMQDKTNSYNYLVGFSERYKSDDYDGIDEPDKVASFRLSRIIDPKVSTRRSANLSQERKKIIESELHKKGPAFLIGDVEPIIVKFTDNGLDLFKKHLLYMRPSFYEIDENDKHIYIFYCTQLRAEHYFSRFGKDAYIIEPKSLHDKIQLFYENGSKKYLEPPKKDK